MPSSGLIRLYFISLGSGVLLGRCPVTSSLGDDRCPGCRRMNFPYLTVAGVLDVIGLASLVDSGRCPECHGVRCPHRVGHDSGVCDKVSS